MADGHDLTLVSLHHHSLHHHIRGISLLRTLWA